MKKKRKDNHKKWKSKQKMRAKDSRDDEIESRDENNNCDPLAFEDEEPEDYLKQFFEGVGSVKVKNLAKDPMLECIAAFLSLGTKFTPVQLDVDRAQMEVDFEAWIRRLRLRHEFHDSDDNRSFEQVLDTTSR